MNTQLLDNIISSLKDASDESRRKGKTCRDTWGWTDLRTMEGVREACQAYAEAEAHYAESRAYDTIVHLLKDVLAEGETHDRT